MDETAQMARTTVTFSFSCQRGEAWEAVETLIPILTSTSEHWPPNLRQLQILIDSGPSAGE